MNLERKIENKKRKYFPTWQLPLKIKKNKNLPTELNRRFYPLLCGFFFKSKRKLKIFKNKNGQIKYFLPPHINKIYKETSYKIRYKIFRSRIYIKLIVQYKSSY